MSEEISIMTEEKKPRKKHKPFTAAGKLSAHWSKFLERIRSTTDLPIHKWTDYEMLSYICHKFESVCNSPYSFSLSGAPSKCNEMFLTKKIGLVLESDNPKYIKDYIDWVFEKKIATGKVKLTSIGFFSNPKLANEFKSYYIESKKIKRSTPLPETCINIANEMSIDVSSYGDLAFIKMALKDNSDGMELYNEFIDKLYSISFDLTILDNLCE